MAGCKTENWTVKELSDALQNNHKDNKIIVVPMFQRGQRWNKDQQQTFIDSLIKGYPVGTLLFYEKYENGQFHYILVDGLQRGSCIRNYMTNPTEFFYDDNISDDTCSKILSTLDIDDTTNYAIIRSVLTDFIKKQKSFKNIQFFEVAGQICQQLDAIDDYKAIGKVTNIISDFFKDKQDLYEAIASTTVPVNVYSGLEENLPDIFERINSKGTPLDQYEIYAASWPINDKFVTQNPEIIEYVVKKYDTLVNAGYTIHGYNREELRKERKVNAFEYLFGLSRFLVNKYEVLAFEKNLADDAVNHLAFELVNACLNDTDRIKILYKRLSEIDVNAFESALIKVINYVIESISVITRFKGNARNAKKIFHTKYQIMSMISTSFKEMYSTDDFKSIDKDWDEKKHIISRNLVHYYVYDIITNYWGEGGTGKIHAAAKPNRYMTEISGKAWAVALDSFFERSMQRSENKKIANPQSDEYVLLNCIYVKTFTAMDQLSVDKFDVEHIAPKEQMRKLITACDGDGLPISCIANLCYLPESANRSKGKKNFYQDKRYLTFVNLADVESKYSFTEQEDLEWMDMPYGKDDFPVLKEYYTEYCTKRFEKLKHLFCESLGISYVALEDSDENKTSEIVISSKSYQSITEKTVKHGSFAANCVHRIADSIGQDLIKLSRGSFKTRLDEYGFAITTSKAYMQGKKEKYWFAYRRTAAIMSCDQPYYVFGCKDENTMVKLPISLLENSLDRLNASVDDDGNITHWHIVFFKYPDGHMTWLLSRPEIEEINIDEYLL